MYEQTIQIITNHPFVEGYVKLSATYIGSKKAEVNASVYLYTTNGIPATEHIHGFYFAIYDVELDTYHMELLEENAQIEPKNEANPEMNCIRSGVNSQIDHDNSGLFDNTIGSEWEVICEYWADDFDGNWVYLGRLDGSGEPLTLNYKNASMVEPAQDTAQMGKDVILAIERSNSAYTHTLYYEIVNGIRNKFASEIANSYIWTIPDFSYDFNNALSGKIKIWCITYNKGAFIGSYVTELEVHVPDPSLINIPDDITLGSECSIGCQRNSTNFTVKLELEVKGTTFQITEGKIDNAKWIPEYDIAKQFPTLTYATGTLKCTTFNGTAEVGSRTVTVRVIVPENDITKPTTISLSTDPLPYMGFGHTYIRGKTAISSQFQVSSLYSNVVDCCLSVCSKKYHAVPGVRGYAIFSTDILTREGDIEVIATATDARGYSSTMRKTIKVLPYRNPRIIPCNECSQIICERAMDNGELSSNGTYLAIKAGKSFSSLVIGGTEQNNCTLRYRWKPNGAASYSDWITLLAADSEETEVSLLVGNVVNDLQRSYMVEMEATDALDGRHTLTFQIMTAAISFVLYDGPDGAGFGKYPEEPHVVDIASHMTLRVRGKLVVDGSDWIDIGLADGASESIYPYGKKEISGCHYQVTDGNHVYVAFDCIFEYSGSSMTINQNAIPEEHRPKRTTYALCPINDRGIALVSVDTSGYIRVEWVQNLTDMARTVSTAVEWMDGYLDYWT